jgi:hypothetical protein
MILSFFFASFNSYSTLNMFRRFLKFRNSSKIVLGPHLAIYIASREVYVH